ncbi:MAG: hypothetical protein ACSLE0_23470 [Chitinophagaceae bacterium]
MAKLKEIIYDVREALKEFADDSELDNRYITYLYNIKRAKYLRQELNNYNRRIDLSIQQSICLSMELVDGDDCGEDCPKLLRSTLPVPTPLELHTKPAIISVKPTTKIAIPFNFITKQKIAFIDGAQFASGLYSFLDDDGYLYVYSLSSAYKLLKCVTVTGVFANPLELADYPACCDCTAFDSPCYDEMEDEYPLQPHFIDLIRMEIVKELAGLKQLPEDKINDANTI